MHEWHAQEGMQFVPTLAARFCTDTEKQRSCRAQNTRKCYGGTVRRGENERRRVYRSDEGRNKDINGKRENE